MALDIYAVNAQGAVRRKQSQAPKWAWLRKNRGTFDREPRDPTQGRRDHRDRPGRLDRLGRARHRGHRRGRHPHHGAGDPEIDADVIAIVEAEDRPSLVRLNKELLGGRYEHVMLVDGNDDRGIDVGIMTKKGFEIESIRSNVDVKDRGGPVFSRDCPQYEIRTPSGETVHVLVNHFKSQSGGGGPKRKRQAKEVRRIADELVAAGKNVIVLGDLNEGQPSAEKPAPNLKVLFDPAGPLVSCYELPGFETGEPLGTFDSCGIRNRLDYLLVSRSLQPRFRSGRLFRKGLWGSRATRPTAWETYDGDGGHNQQASDHAAVVVELDL